MVTDYIRIKAGKVFGFILRRLSEKRKPQILSFFKAEQQSSEPTTVERNKVKSISPSRKYVHMYRL